MNLGPLCLMTSVHILWNLGKSTVLSRFSLLYLLEISFPHTIMHFCSIDGLSKTFCMQFLSFIKFGLRSLAAETKSQKSSFSHFKQ